MSHLLDVIAQNANLTYLSDLHDCIHWSDILSVLQSIAPDDYQLKDWQETYRYITNAPSSHFCHPAQLRDALISLLTP